MSSGVALAGQVRARVLTALILLAFIACALCSSTCECDTPQVRVVLTKFFNATGGMGWKNRGSWITTDPVCSWYGIGCRGADLTDIKLVGNNLTGTLPADLANITTIQRIDICSNKLYGSLPPEWSAMTQLLELSLSVNQLSGALPPEWSAMTKIQQLSLDFNKLNGTLPPQWSAMTRLVEMHLQANHFNCSMPSQWCTMTILRVLDLSFNQLSGSLPPEWSAMTQLNYLFLHGNMCFSGSLPPQWSAFTQIQQLSLDFNCLSGSLPDDWNAMTKLERLRLGNNQFTGPLPRWGNMTQLMELRLDGNSLSGPLAPCDLPHWNVSFMSNNKYHHYDFSYNRFSGRLQLPCLSIDPCSGKYRVELNDTVLKSNQLCGICSIECQCTKTENTGIDSPNLALVRAPSSAECCSLCIEFPKCVAAVYHHDNNYCELKNVTSPTVAIPNADVLVLH